MHSEESFEGQGRVLHLRDYFRIISKRKALLLTIVCIAVLAAILSAFSTIPLYTASTRILIDKNLDTGRIEGVNNAYAGWDPSFQQTQFEMIRSESVTLRVVKNLQLDTKYRHYFLQNKPSSPGLSSLVINWLSSLITDTVGALEGLISPDLAQNEENVEDTTAADSEKITSKPESDAEKIAEMIQRSISVKPVRNTKLADVFYTHRKPEMAQLIADALVQAYIDETLDIKTSTARNALQWMTAKAAEEQKKLEASEQNLQQYMREHDIITVENRLTVLPERLSGFSKELSEAQTKEKEQEAIYQQIARAGKDYSALETIPLFADNPVLRQLRTQMVTSEQKVRELSTKYGEKHPSMQQALEEQRVLQRERRAEIDRITSAARNAYELARAKVRDISAMMNETKAELQNTNERFVQYSILNRNKDMNRTVFEALSSSIKKTDVTAESMDIKIWAVKKAELPKFPSKPNKKLSLLIGLVVGLGGGFGLIFFLDYLDNTAGSGKEIEERYGLTVLGSVADMTGKKHNIETFVRDNPLSPMAESYRLIRSSLMLSTPERPPKVILMTSMVQQEGKSTTTKNLAHILAQNEKKVLIVDCDMRRPRQHSMFGIANTYGLSNYLSGNTDEKQVLIRQLPETQVYLITSGPVPPNPAELLTSSKMVQLIKENQAQFDFILLDSPPVQQVTDSLALGPLADGTVLVVKAGHTTYEMLDSGIKRLREGHSHLLGIVLNRLKKKHADKGYYGYYSSYSHYSQYSTYSNKGDKKKKEAQKQEA
ncbi:MAG: capsular exopolysaccharide family [Candidatus Electronema aureum]|uniref:non-specific protein-tyrosine kinase n=1 Tax=Candidatus Electronema aureum TaxID=2005002 RepID=A0A521G0K5_9BACT|nr:MAG: capsular exopolysaccharide family [Candidatus Electronema aureum]